MLRYTFLPMFRILINCARFGSTYTKIGTIQRRLAWPLRKDDTQIREAFHIKKNLKKKKKETSPVNCFLVLKFLIVYIIGK